MRHAFDAALEDAEPREPAPPAPSRDFAKLVPVLPAPPQQGAGSHSLWELAAAWTPEADPPPPRPAPPDPPRPSGRPEDIAVELGLKALKTRIDVARVRRRFMWENHPDRRKDLDRDLANRRVAIANMLLDRALASFVKRTR
jgi:hypothetical protein